MFNTHEIYEKKGSGYVGQSLVTHTTKAHNHQRRKDPLMSAKAW